MKITVTWVNENDLPVFERAINNICIGDTVTISPVVPGVKIELQDHVMCEQAGEELRENILKLDLLKIDRMVIRID